MPAPDRRRISELNSHPQAHVTVPAFAAYLEVQVKTVMKWINAGLLPAYRLQGLWRIRKEDAVAFVERARFQPSDD